MLTYVRYALASVCFAASVACLALWWRAVARRVYIPATVTRFQVDGLYFEAYAGTGVVSLAVDNLFYLDSGRKALSDEELRAAVVEYKTRRSHLGRLGRFGRSFYSPLWYPALIFALAGVGALRLGRRLTLRSAIIATTVVAGLLGTAVGL